MTEKIDPIRPTDAEARALARDLMQQARFGALGVIAPDTGMPMVTRVALLPHPEAGMISLISDLSAHSAALAANPAASLLIGEVGPKGDPLTHPRLTLQAQAKAEDKAGLRDYVLGLLPKAKLYYDFTDFRLLRFDPILGLLNGGFGRAYRLGPDDLRA